MTKKQIQKKREQLGAVLIEERENRNLKITEAAKLIGISHQNLTNLETGKHFNFCTAVLVCSYYGLEVSIIQKAVS